MLDFLGIGAQKAGTTWLWHNLARHPAVEFPGQKEVHFWDEHYDRGIGWYAAIFAREDGRRQGEITPAYACLELARIREIHALNPNLRLIYILRDPIDRAWAAARMSLARSEMSLHEASDAWFIDHFNSKGSRQRSDYLSALQRFMSVFSPEQFLIIHFAAIQNHPRRVLEACARHLAVDPAYFSNPAHEPSGPLHAGRPAPLRPPLRTHLESLYEGAMQRVEAFLNGPGKGHRGLQET